MTCARSSLKSSHTGAHLAEVTAGCMKRFGLEKKVWNKFYLDFPPP